MDKLFSEINNCYNLRYSEVSVKYKRKYIYILNKLSSLNLIKSYKIQRDRTISIYLRYWSNKPLFILTNYYFKSNLHYVKIKSLKTHITTSGSLRLYTTTKGILTLDEMIIKNLGGKLLVDINFNSKNIL